MRAEVRDRRGPCVYCGGAIDYDGDPNAPRSFTVAHRLPVATHPDLAEDWSNIAGAAHRACNSSVGAHAAPELAVGLASEDA